MDKNYRMLRPPNTLPLLGNALCFLKPRHTLFHWFSRCERQFGFETFEIAVPTLPPGVVINDPKNLEYVLKNEHLFAKGDFFKERSHDLFGNGIINVDGELWKIQRRAGLRFFSTSNLERIVDEELPQFLKTTTCDLAKKAQGKMTVDLQDVFLQLTTRIMGKLAYNMDMDASSPFSQAFEFASGATGERFQNPLWRITEVFFGAQLRSSLLEVKRFGKRIVAKAMAERKTKRVLGEDNDDLKDTHLIDLLVDGLEDQELVADAALNFLSAGKDTLAQALTWTFYMLMRNPHVMTNVREELVAISRDDRYLDLSYSSVQPSHMPYVCAVFNEALRMYPPVPFEMKSCQSPTTLPDGTFLPKLAQVLWCPWAMNRSQLIWGPDADEFLPERWLEKIAADETQNRAHFRLKSKSVFDFPVFNGGPRLCLGRRMAESQAVYIISALVWQFDFIEIMECGSSDSVSAERISRNSLTLPMEGGLPCIVTQRC
ncbi:MAG: hypothetical protein M1827_006607 [Pycnora praestabilis]|nr:MAG: hypothetical protein M1827_006607 [Pycnora praestabilis]